MNNYDDTTFQEVKAIVERRFARRLKFVRRFLVGLFSIPAVFMLILRISAHAYRTADGFIVWDKYAQYHPIIDLAGTAIIGGIVCWVILAFFEMLNGNAKDRGLHREINEERKWRLRQWETGMYGDGSPPAYLLTDDGEIEEEIYQDKRKRIET